MIVLQVDLFVPYSAKTNTDIDIYKVFFSAKRNKISYQGFYVVDTKKESVSFVGTKHLSNFTDYEVICSSDKNNNIVVEDAIKDKKLKTILFNNILDNIPKIINVEIEFNKLPPYKKYKKESVSELISFFDNKINKFKSINELSESIEELRETFLVQYENSSSLSNTIQTKDIVLFKALELVIKNNPILKQIFYGGSIDFNINNYFVLIMMLASDKDFILSLNPIVINNLLQMVNNYDLEHIKDIINMYKQKTKMSININSISSDIVNRLSECSYFDKATIIYKGDVCFSGSIIPIFPNKNKQSIVGISDNKVVFFLDFSNIEDVVFRAFCENNKIYNKDKKYSIILVLEN